MPRFASAVAKTVVATLFVGACLSAVAAASAPPEHLQLTVSPRVSAVDTLLSIRVSGLTPGQTVTPSVTSVDAKGVKWSSSSTYKAVPAGTVDPAVTPAFAGGYTGVDAMGPPWRQAPPPQRVREPGPPCQLRAIFVPS